MVAGVVCRYGQDADGAPDRQDAECEGAQDHQRARDTQQVRGPERGERAQVVRGRRGGTEKGQSEKA